MGGQPCRAREGARLSTNPGGAEGRAGVTLEERKALDSWPETRGEPIPKGGRGGAGTGSREAHPGGHGSGQEAQSQDQTRAGGQGLLLGDPDADLTAPEVHPQQRPQGRVVHQGTGRRPISPGMTFIKVTQPGWWTETPPREPRPTGRLPGLLLPNRKVPCLAHGGWSEPQAAPAHPSVSSHKETTEWKNN